MLTTEERTVARDEFLTEHLGADVYARNREHYAYSLPSEAIRYRSSDELIRDQSSYYFTPDTQRTFKTKIDQFYDGRFLVISNRYGYDGAQRFYRVVWAVELPATCDNASHRKVSVEELGTDFPTLDKARRAALKLAQLTASV
jgi:hypothetical protein